MGRTFLNCLKENNNNKKTVQQIQVCFVAKKKYGQTIESAFFLLPLELQ